MTRELLGSSVRPTDKGLPAWATGLTLDEFARRRPDLRSGGFLYPLLTADHAALDGNIAAMAEYARQHDAMLCPHGKTTMSPQVIQRQLDAGAWGMTAATISQVRTFRAFGVDRILLASELVDPAGLDWVLAELERDPGFEFFAYVDAPAGVDAVRAALERHGRGRPLQLLVELGVPGGRTGCRTISQAVDVARDVLGLRGACLAGVAGYEGVLTKDNEPSVISAVRAYLGDLRDLLHLVADMASDPTSGSLSGELIVTAGGSMWFDVVVEELGSTATRGHGRLVLRSGCYVAHDHGTYAASGPATRRQGPELRPALRLWGQVLSVPEPGLALAGLGRRDCSFDMGLPVPLARLTEGSLEPMRDVHTAALNDQHAFLRHHGTLSIGDRLSFGISHPCTTFDKWRVIPVVDDDLTVTDCLTTWF